MVAADQNADANLKPGSADKQNEKKGDKPGDHSNDQKKSSDVSERRRKKKDEKSVSERRRKKKSVTEKGSETSERHRKRKHDKNDVSERKRKQKDKDNEDKGDLSERKKKQRDKDKNDVSEKRKKKSGEPLEKSKPVSTSPETSEKRKKKAGATDSFRMRVKKFVGTMITQESKSKEPIGKSSGKASSKKGSREEASTKEKPTGKTRPTEEQKAAFEAFVKGVFDIGVEGLLAEYAILKPYLASNYAREIFDQNPTKNRYKDVICNDLTRVIIKDGKGSDYIHANYVKGDHLQNTFICTQGPIIATIVDFWRMILSENVSHIIMLCDTIEQGKMKCEQYWPNEQDEKMEISDFTLTNLKVSTVDPHVVRSTIDIAVAGGQHHKVKHHRWRTWPDKTVPKSLLAVFRILQSVRGSSNPIVVHCSAGIGRTGSMVAIEMGLQTLLAGQKLVLLELCRHLRDQRMHSVQVEVQYVYIAEALCEYGKAMGYWNKPELLSQYVKFKAAFDDYVAKLTAQQQLKQQMQQQQMQMQQQQQQNPAGAPMGGGVASPMQSPFMSPVEPPPPARVAGGANIPPPPPPPRPPPYAAAAPAPIAQATPVAPAAQKTTPGPPPYPGGAPPPPKIAPSCPPKPKTPAATRLPVAQSPVAPAENGGQFAPVAPRSVYAAYLR